jgi:two-component system chemotaxis response regulator CheY
MKCLVIDDDKLSRELTTSMLDGVAECDQAATGSEAIDLFSAALVTAAPYDLVLLDIVMPGMNGHETAKAIRAKEKEHNPDKKVMIVMLTVLNSPNDAFESLLNAQSAAYLIKPVTKENLLGVLSRLGLKR